MRLSRGAAAAAGLAAGWVLDQVVGDPRRWHPVAGFGTLAGRLRDAIYADSRGRGTAYAAILVGGSAFAGLAADRLTARHPVPRLLMTAAATWTVIGGTGLGRAADAVRAPLAAGDLGTAREKVGHIVGRDPSRLTGDGVARACVESVAENTVDAVVAPLLWGSVAGIPGLLAYRAANTLDAMVGHRTPRYERFGWASARLDDVLNYVPARITGGIVALLAPTVGGRGTDVVRIIRRDAGQHPSPNAGVAESGFAAALGIRLGGVNEYDGHVEDRGTLGDGPPASATDIPRATRLSRLVGAAAATLAAAAALTTAALSHKNARA